MMTENIGTKIIISLIAIALGVARAIWPNLQIDAVTIGLLVVAFLPWASSLLESAKFPGGWEVKFRNLEQAVEETKAQVARAEKAAERALELVYRQLETDSEVPYEQLKEAISAAPPSTRAEIWEKAQRRRRENWRDRKEIMELSIPVFKALVELDTNDEYHRYHAQLGYALKDKKKPDWMRAEAEISKAIEIRDKKGEGNFINYEFNRAICKIHLDDHFLIKQKSPPAIRESILTDLSVAALNPTTLERIESISPFTDWIELNGISSEEYRSGKYLPTIWK